MTRTRQQLLENFDDEVREKLRVSDESSRQYLNNFELMLMQLTRHELGGHAEFLNDSAFRLKSSPLNGQIPLGLYELPRRSGEAHLYRLSHPLAEWVLQRAKSRHLPASEIVFDLTKHTGKISVLEPFLGQSGLLTLALLTVESLDQVEDHLIFAAITDQGQPLDEEAARRLFAVPARVVREIPDATGTPGLDEVLRQRQTAIQKTISQRNAAFFEAEAEKLDGWADDLKVGLEREIKELDRQIKEARRAATAALTLEEKLAGQKQVKALESQRNTKRRALFDAQDDIDRRREQLIAEIEGKLQQRTELQKLFSIKWKVA
jgi:adenine-specific DNA-methyltransferase